MLKLKKTLRLKRMPRLKEVLRVKKVLRLKKTLRLKEMEMRQQTPEHPTHLLRPDLLQEGRRLSATASQLHRTE